MFMCVYPWIYTCTKKHQKLMWHILVTPFNFWNEDNYEIFPQIIHALFSSFPILTVLSIYSTYWMVVLVLWQSMPLPLGPLSTLGCPRCRAPCPNPSQHNPGSSWLRVPKNQTKTSTLQISYFLPKRGIFQWNVDSMNTFSIFFSYFSFQSTIINLHKGAYYFSYKHWIC